MTGKKRVHMPSMRKRPQRLAHATIGATVRKAGLFEAAKAPFMLSNRGGGISRAMTLHMSAVFPTATFPTSNAMDVYGDDVRRHSAPQSSSPAGEN